MICRIKLCVSVCRCSNAVPISRSARSADPGKACVLTIGSFSAGSAPNIIPDTAVLQGTLRTNDAASREKPVRRLKEVVHKTAEVFGGMAEIEMISEVPPVLRTARFAGWKNINKV